MAVVWCEDILRVLTLVMSGLEGEGPVHTTSEKNSFKEANSGKLGQRGRSRNLLVEAAVEAKEQAKPAQKAKGAQKKRLRKKKKSEEESEEPEEPKVTIVFVDDNDDDDDEVMIDDDEVEDGVALPSTPKKGSLKARKKRAPDATGVSPKALDHFIVDSKGKNYEAKDGFVRININKLLFRQVTTEDLKLDLKNKLDSDGKRLTTQHFECLVPATDPAHRKFHLIGDNSGNFGKHAKKMHRPVIEALKRVILENPKEEALEKCRQFLTKLPPPSGGLGGWVTRVSHVGTDDANDKQEDLMSEACALLWFLDADIAFDQFNNPLFHQFIRQLTGDAERRLASSTTVVESILPALYQFSTDDMVEIHLSKWRAFYNSFDGWSKFGRRFVSQHYHGIDDRTFTYAALLLDLIPINVNHYKEVLAGALITRQDYWTGKMNEAIQPLRAGGVADGASDMQAAGAIMFNDGDQSHCQNHGLNSVYKDLRDLDIAFSRDASALFHMISFVVGNSTINASLRIYQFTNELCALQLVMANDTRWDGELRAIERALELKDSLPVLTGIREYVKWSERVLDFLQASYFRRLQSYVPLLQLMRSASKLYQSQKYPTGCFVPLMVDELCRACIRLEQEQEHVVELKDSMRSVLQKRLSYILEPANGSTNPFLMAAALHPGVWATLRVRKAVSEAVQQATIEGICVESKNVMGDDDAHEMIESVLTKGAYQNVVMELEKTINADDALNFDVIVGTGELCSVQHLKFWKSVVDKVHKKHMTLQLLVPTAAVLLALPASEAIDETVFSRTGRILSKHRTSLSDPNVERMTVIRMFVENSGLSIMQLNRWVKRALAELKK